MIDIQNCTKKYGDITAVDNLSLKIGGGEIFGLLGPNGAGKSTLIKMITGLIKPDSGNIKLKGNDIAKDPVSAKQVLAYVPEKAFIYDKLTAWEYLQFISGLYKQGKNIFEDRASEYLQIFSLSEWKNELIGNFSMGMKQRLVLTSVFMRDPEIIILDEPHNGLDPKGIRLLKDVLFSMRDKGKIIILSTHIIAVAEQICSRIAIINKGAIVAQGTGEDLRQYSRSTDKSLEDIFLRLTSDYESAGELS